MCLKAPFSIGTIAIPGSFGSAPPNIAYEINLFGAPLRMTIFVGVSKRTLGAYGTA
jgi:hypothetical protein